MTRTERVELNGMPEMTEERARAPKTPFFLAERMETEERPAAGVARHSEKWNELHSCTIDCLIVWSIDSLHPCLIASWLWTFNLKDLSMPPVLMSWLIASWLDLSRIIAFSKPQIIFARRAFESAAQVIAAPLNLPSSHNGFVLTFRIQIDTVIRISPPLRQLTPWRPDVAHFAGIGHSCICNLALKLSVQEVCFVSALSGQETTVRMRIPSCLAASGCIS